MTRPGTSNPTALLVFLEGFRLFAEHDKFFDLCFVFPGKEVHDCFRDCLIYHFLEDGGVHADIQFFGDKNHRFIFRITLAGLPKAECRKRIEYYLKKTSLIEHRKKKMKQLSGGMKRRVGLVQALLNGPEFLIVDEPTTGLDPEERIRIRNLLVDFSENRTVLFSTHVVEVLAATCNQLAIMHKGSFLYAGSMKNLAEEAQGKIWVCKVPDEEKAREVERKYRITSKQYVEGGLQLRVISEIQPELECMSVPATLEDAYIYFTNRYNK